MKRIYLGLLLSIGFTVNYAQTCTLSGAGTIKWINATPPSCLEGGDVTGKSIVVIPVGVTLSFDNTPPPPGGTWTGTRMDVYGTLQIDFNVTLNSSVAVYSGGLVNLTAGLSLGSAPAGCGYSMTIYSGGTVDVGVTGSDKLLICGVPVIKGAGVCNNCFGTNSGTCAYDGNPYCEPTGGFTGPLGYTDTGYDGALPVTLLYFTATLVGKEVVLDWATAMEEDFEKFIIERSSTGLNFQPIGEVEGVGRNIYDVESKYSFVDTSPLLGFNYYRLKALDLDGSYEYFDVRVVKLSGPKQLSVYPNPSSGKSISFDINFNPSDNDMVLLVNNLGVELLRQPVKDFENQFIFDSDLSPGVYILKYLSRDFEMAARVMVSH